MNQHKFLEPDKDIIFENEGYIIFNFNCKSTFYKSKYLFYSNLGNYHNEQIDFRSDELLCFYKKEKKEITYNHILKYGDFSSFSVFVEYALYENFFTNNLKTNEIKYKPLINLLKNIVDNINFERLSYNEKRDFRQWLICYFSYLRNIFDLTYYTEIYEKFKLTNKLGKLFKLIHKKRFKYSKDYPTFDYENPKHGILNGHDFGLSFFNYAKSLEGLYIRCNPHDLIYTDQDIILGKMKFDKDKPKWIIIDGLSCTVTSVKKMLVKNMGYPSEKIYRIDQTI